MKYLLTPVLILLRAVVMIFIALLMVLIPVARFIWDFRWNGISWDRDINTEADTDRINTSIIRYPTAIHWIFMIGGKSENVEVLDTEEF